MTERHDFLAMILETDQAKAANAFGIDVSLTLQNMMLSPEERLEITVRRMKECARLRGTASPAKQRVDA